MKRLDKIEKMLSEIQAELEGIKADKQREMERDAQRELREMERETLNFTEAADEAGKALEKAAEASVKLCVDGKLIAEALGSASEKSEKSKKERDARIEARKAQRDERQKERENLCEQLFEIVSNKRGRRDDDEALVMLRMHILKKLMKLETPVIINAN